jgi:hypothetical protein
MKGPQRAERRAPRAAFAPLRAAHGSVVACLLRTRSRRPLARARTQPRSCIFWRRAAPDASLRVTRRRSGTVWHAAVVRGDPVLGHESYPDRFPFSGLMTWERNAKKQAAVAESALEKQRRKRAEGSALAVGGGPLRARRQAAPRPGPRKQDGRSLAAHAKRGRAEVLKRAWVFRGIVAGCILRLTAAPPIMHTNDTPGRALSRCDCRCHPRDGQPRHPPRPRFS